MTIVSKNRILSEYKRIYDDHKNDARRFAEVAKQLGIEVEQVVKTIHQSETEHI